MTTFQLVVFYFMVAMIWLLCGAFGAYIWVKADEKTDRLKMDKMRFCGETKVSEMAMIYALGLITLVISILAMARLTTKE